ncbi:type VI secretion system tube protein Hcp [Luteolibacter arcticus]|uniref:Type VI secretion system tube protein Hcp n=1 Tax=Luteolibacter arcticus TaxID=1581411 RepID=A0ABT3GFP8_9BACT|nr:type VI secretion system tube protein Hcp [Luteolibacter arcticus]MCW1921864.1 type VI secretion system tube protein Hcp [Luteolibacter arcticus]
MTSLRTSRLSKTLALVPPAVALVAQHASGAFDAFIKIGDIVGESTDEKHAGWIELNSVEWNVSRSITAPTSGGSQREVSAPKVSELTLTKLLDRASPAIFLNVVGGTTAIPTVTVELQESGWEQAGVFYRLTLSNVLISSQKHVTADGEDRPKETVSLNFTRIKIEYFYEDAKGGLIPATPVQFDLSKGTAS